MWRAFQALFIFPFGGQFNMDFVCVKTYVLYVIVWYVYICTVL